ncbi:hypothetical protein KsCSTR_13540 [Candidatus Kuenenia stuttgartiensis]|uniref:Uncharacterized protein n=1 Tax=Kuenenia stuttgartiensis TaxID=174633 RepID=A0A6G7GN34_KUEST|nr:hypothetical protein KsCSTR_13540 [Candidatus Kuenenia stuttgartiensis]
MPNNLDAIDVLILLNFGLLR